jgi:predicted heme/steroid binding protein
MSNDNDLIRRGDAEIEIKSIIGSVSNTPYTDAIKAINAIPAVSGGNIWGYTEKDGNTAHRVELVNNWKPENKARLAVTLYTTPQDQTARIAELEDSNQKLIIAAKGVVCRWNSPNWADGTHTADYIDALDKAIKNTQKALNIAKHN